MKNKKIYIISFALLAFLLFGHIINSSIVCLIAGVFVYGSILICDSRTSTGLLFFFFPFSYLFAYNQYSLCIFMAVAYILKSVSKGKIFTTAFYTIILLAYSLLFADYDIGNVKLGTMIPPILISLLIFVCEETEETDYLTMIELFKNSFIISAVIGFFKDEIPSISRLFVVDYVNDASGVESGSVLRYSGLTYDPNFFTVVNCILIAIILMTTKKFTIKTLVELLFLVVTGFLTFSKSYIIIVVVIAIIYLLRRSLFVGRNLLILIGFIVALVTVERLVNIDLFDVVISRFNSTGENGDLTTGRLELWKEYIIYILDRTRVWFFGAGINALPLDVKAVHNTYIDFVYRYGLVGSLLWFVYFIMCYRRISQKVPVKSNKATNLPLLVCVLGFMFLSAFMFQQLWCCFCLVFFAMNIPKEEEKCLN